MSLSWLCHMLYKTMSSQDEVIYCWGLSCMQHISIFTTHKHFLH
uniref:Uncharacterized protein n=1 Tax=Arundo donax TaxID=35708 RepID=A0A0A9GXB3_ARUDO